MSSFLLYSRQTATTGRRIGRLLGISHGRSVSRDRDRLDHLIRWGNSASIPLRPRNVLNSRSAINLVTDKFHFLREAGQRGVPVPKAVQLTDLTAKGFTFPCLARRIRHQQGKDILLCMQAFDALKALTSGREYLVEYIPTATEYRIHVFNDEVIKVSQKVLTDQTKSVPWIRNFETGFTFRNPRQEPSRMTRWAALQAVSGFGLKFGAVDVIVSDQGMPFVLEVNTGPGLVPSGLELYASKFAQILGIGNLNQEVLDEIRAEDNNEAELRNNREEEAD